MFSRMQSAKKIGPRIAESRKRKGYSQTELGTLVGVSQPTVSDWENDRTEPTVDNLRILAVELDVYFEWLSTGRGPRDYQVHGNKEEAHEYRVDRTTRKDEDELLGVYRKLSPARRSALLDFLKKW